VLFFLSKQLLKLRSSPLPSWGPALARNRKERYDLAQSGRQIFDPDRPIAISNARDLLSVLGPCELARLMGSTDSSISTAGSSMTLATSVGTSNLNIATSTSGMAASTGRLPHSAIVSQRLQGALAKILPPTQPTQSSSSPSASSSASYKKQDNGNICESKS
jgi:hypothetical protein